MNIPLLIEIFLTFLKIGIVMFGGGYAMIPILRYEIVVRRQWISEQEFVDLIAIAESTPGPIAINSATYVGYKVGGIVGSALATLGIVIPSFTIILCVAIALSRFYTHRLVRGVLNGIRGAVIGLVLSALIVLIRGVLKGLAPISTIITLGIALVIFISIAVFDLDPVMLIALSALIGLILALIGIW